MNTVQRPLNCQPWLFPWRISRHQEFVEFVQMTRQSFHACPFHNRQYLASRSFTRRRVSFVDLDAFCSHNLEGLFPPRYIFHHAFCCSTLLSRYLHHSGVTFAYREPAGITELALLDVCDRAFLSSESGCLLVRNIAKLHRRTEFIDEVALIKACDLTTGILDRLITLEPDARAVIIYSNLDSFVLSCLKAKSRRAWMKHRVRLVYRWDLPKVLQITPGKLSDGEAAASLWAAYIHMLRSIALRYHDRLLLLDCAELLRSPAYTVRNVATFFDMPAGLLGDPAQVGVVHAKTGLPYTYTARQKELKQLRIQWQHELNRARRWSYDRCIEVVKPFGRLDRTQAVRAQIYPG